MRTLVDIPDRQISQLNALCRDSNVSRAELIRQAITAFLKKKKPVKADAFGIWGGDNQIDGLTYQAQRRAEWE